MTGELSECQVQLLAWLDVVRAPIKADWKPEDPPDLNKPRKSPKMRPVSLPKWWNQMYNRNAKSIPSNTWDKLMTPVEWREVLSTIHQTGVEKAAGWDGVNSDLVRLLTEDSNEPTPLLALLTNFINISFEAGQTPKSWRKAINQ